MSMYPDFDRSLLLEEDPPKRGKTGRPPKEYLKRLVEEQGKLPDEVQINLGENPYELNMGH